MNIMTFQKHDMLETYYHWRDGAGTLPFEGNPTRRPFDRFNGDQVLFIINFYGSLQDGFGLAECRKLENAICHQLPLSVKSEISVFNWIRNIDLSAAQ